MAFRKFLKADEEPEDSPFPTVYVILVSSEFSSRPAQGQRRRRRRREDEADEDDEDVAAGLAVVLCFSG